MVTFLVRLYSSGSKAWNQGSFVSNTNLTFTLALPKVDTGPYISSSLCRAPLIFGTLTYIFSLDNEDGLKMRD